MRQARLTLIGLVGVLAALLAAPGAVLAADTTTVTGTVTRDGAPVPGVEVVVSVGGSDVIASAATDEDGAFSVDIEAGVGSELRVFATGQTTRSGPDEQGCVRSETPIGQLTVTIDALPPAPLSVALDDLLTSKVCGATGKPGVTPPSTDAPAPRPAGSPGGGLALVLGALALAGAASLVLRPRRD